MTQDFLILTAPPASGKTYWIERFHAALNGQSLLVVSPLRALADECKVKWNEAITVVTPEEWEIKKDHYDVIIFDEFHLFFYWGDSFRPRMWEAFYGLSVHAKLVVALTATLPLNFQQELELFSVHFSSVIWIDNGNQKLKTTPSHYRKSPSKAWMKKAIELFHEPHSVDLIFCAYRQEVFQWQAHLERQGFSVCTCVGGEAKEMKYKLALNPRPDFIVATTVLSHGVNLPEIKTVYLTYKIANADFWIQMVARGGRRGEAHDVFALENPSGIKWNKWINSLAILKLSFTMELKSISRFIIQWFLKDSSSTASPTKSAISL